MKSAKEMFEDLGYKVIEEDKYWLVYGKDGVDMIDLEFTFSKTIIPNEKIIKFGKPYHTINVEDVKLITLEELQAINKQVEELGWK